MPPPASTDELVQRLRRSGLVPGADLDVYVAGLGPDIPPREVLDRMVADRLLTPFQANRLSVGKYKGFLLGGYIILDKIGTGGMGQVFLAEHASMRRLVAIKVMPAGTVAEDAVARERFVREARAAAVLNHPNIVRVFDLNREGGLPYLVMEYIDGLSLQELVTQSGPVAHPAAADYARQVAHGLQHAHEKGLVHRDIKPGNVLIDRDGAARILDLGLVRTIDDIDTKLTNQLGGSSILGTADYLAPEQAVDSSKVDIRADVYSLGATLYFMLAGHPMFPDGRTAQKLMWQQWKEPTPIRELKPDVPEGLAAVVHKAIAKKAADRFQTPQEMADALAPFAAGPARPDPALIPATPGRRWSAKSGDLNPAAPSRASGLNRAAGGMASSGGSMSGVKSAAPPPDSVWSQRPPTPDDTPRMAQPTPPPRPAAIPPKAPTFDRPTPMPPPSALALGSDGRPGSGEVPIGMSGDLHERAREPAAAPSGKPPSRLPLAVGLLVGMLVAGAAVFFLVAK